ncbi:Glycine--tRNA ligase, partial [Schistosoma japonicum]
CVSRFCMKFAPYCWARQKVVAKVSCELALYFPKFTPCFMTGGAYSVQTKIMNGVNDIESLRAKVRDQGNLVRRLKEEKASDGALKEAVTILKSYKKALDDKEIELSPKDPCFDRAKLEDLLKQKFFFDQSFSIYGGVQGLYDYGPMGCAMKANLLAAWRQFFILEDHLLEVDCSMLTPEPVLKASGHVDRFTDLMVKDVKTGDCFRADHLVKAALEAKKNNKKTSEDEKQEIDKMLLQLDNYGADELHQIICRFNIKSPLTLNDLTEPQEFNLMFSTMIGPTGQCKGYLRPETAQGIFVNFQRLLNFNQGSLPFGAAQIGSAFRNEISPRSGLIRVREFTMAEIEYFVDPSDKRHPKFEEVRNTEMVLYSSCDQMNADRPRRVTIGEAVDQGVVANQTLGYFMARIHLFLVHIGVDPQRMRFRQHLSNEMAHYACDCWDAECQTSYGWIECVGCADRSCYDLNQHSKATGTRLVAEKPLDEPKTVQICECIPNKGELGKAFRGEAKAIIQHLNSLTLDECRCIKNDLMNSGKVTLTVNGKQVDINNSMVQVKEYENIVHVNEIVPNVIEPSFGIGRILYTIFEHSFRVREGDEQRTYLSVSPVLAPYKCSLLPLSNHADFTPFIRKLSAELTKYGVSHRIDESSGSIGRRYARTDQIAIPYGITIDFDTLNKSPASATLRERDSMKQIRVPLDELPSLMSDIANGNKSWNDACDMYPAFEQQETAQKQTTAQNSPSDRFDVSPNSVTKHLNVHEVNDAATVQKISTTETHQHATLDKEHSTEPKATPVGQFGKKTLNWTDCGKTIRKRYKELEEREKALFAQHTMTHSSISNDFLRNTETRGSISGYEADNEDNTCGTTDVSPKHVEDHNIQPSGISTNNSESSTNVPRVTESFMSDDNQTKLDNLSEYPPLSSNDKPRDKIPYHGVFIGDGWPDGNKGQSGPKTNIPHSCASEHYQTTSKSHLPSDSMLHEGQKSENVNKSSENSPEWASVLAKLDQPDFEAEMNQFLDTRVSAARKIHATPNKFNMQYENERVTSQSNESYYHGLFVGGGWPNIKSSKNDIRDGSEKSESRNIEQKEKNLPSDRIEESTNKSEWSSVFSQIPESFVDSEQNQLNQVDLIDFNAFINVQQVSDAQIKPSLQKPKLNPDSRLSPNDQEEIVTVSAPQQRTDIETELTDHCDKVEHNTQLSIEAASNKDTPSNNFEEYNAKNGLDQLVNSSPLILTHVKSDTKQTESEPKPTEVELCLHETNQAYQAIKNEAKQNKATSESHLSADEVNVEVLHDKAESSTLSNNPKHTEITSSKDNAKKHKNKHKKKKKKAT